MDQVRSIIRAITAILLLNLFLDASPLSLRLIDRWEYKDEKFSNVHAAVIDKDGWVICTFFNLGNRMITPKKMIPFAPWGEGPSDVMGVCSLSIYQDRDLAIMENPGRIKIFRKKGEKYEWKETIWLKRNIFSHVPNKALFVNDKWFIAGHEDLNEKGDDVSFLKVYDSKGDFVKNDILLKKYTAGEPMKKRLDVIKRDLVQYKDRFIYISENELKAYIVSIKNLKLEKVVSFKPPYFYKKMPEDFFNFKKYPNGVFGLAKDIEKWRTEYSRITAVTIDSDKLILQIRTCRKDLKKFALLIYDANNLSEKGTIFIDDLLLDAKDGRLYFFAKGDPGYDEDVEQVIINIYTLQGF